MEAVRGEGDVRRDVYTEIGLHNQLTSQDNSLVLKKMNSENFEPVLSQTFESPKENK